MLTSVPNPDATASASALDGAQPDSLVDEAGEDNKKLAFHENPDFRQFVKFCLVGASSTVVNFGITNVMYKTLHQSLFAALTAGFFFSVLNGFFWNRRWTFKGKRGRSRQTQYLRFMLVNLVGFTLNTSIVAAVIAACTGDNEHLGQVGHFVRVVETILTPGGAKGEYPFLLFNGALLAATSVVVFWNYFANKHWTFRQ